VKYFMNVACVFLQAGYTPLHDAAINGYDDIVHYLLNRGAKIDSVNNVSMYVA